MKKKIIVLITLIVFTLVGTAFAARTTPQHSKYDYAPVAKQNWSIIREDNDCIIKASNDAVTDAIYGVSIDGYIPGVIELKRIMKDGGYVRNPDTGKKMPCDTGVYRYLVMRKDGNYVYTMASISYYNKGKFLLDDDYPENYKDLSKYERIPNFDSIAEKLYGNARLPVIK